MTGKRKHNKFIKCLRCQRTLLHEAHGLCRGCYSLERYHKRVKLNLCACGCGQKCVDRYVHGHNGRSEGSLSFDKDGYLRININGKRILLHRLIYEDEYNCCLLPYVVLHHIDKNIYNNFIENLEPMYRDQHLVIHDPLIYRWGHTTF